MYVYIKKDFGFFTSVRLSVLMPHKERQTGQCIFPIGHQTYLKNAFQTLPKCLRILVFPAFIRKDTSFSIYNVINYRLQTQAINDNLRNCIYPVNKLLHGFLNLFAGMKEYIIYHGILQPSPKFLNLIQIRTVWRKIDKLQTILVFFKKFFQKFRVMDLCIIKNNDNLSIWILGKHVFQELQEYLCVVFPVFLHIYMSGFIVQKANQFYTFMFSVCRYYPLFPFGKPGFHNSLIIADHGFIFKQDCGNVTFQQFFLMFQTFS